MNRLLLGWTAALLAARPLVAGEDPGLLSPLSHPAGMVLTLGWFVALVGWAAWRVWTRDETLRTSGGVGLALLALAGLFVLGSFAVAAYRQPAWLSAWEWVSYVSAFFVVRQIARTPEDNHGLLCVLIAGAVSIAAQAVYQSRFELPGLNDNLYKDQRKFEAAQPRQFSHVETDDTVLLLREQAIKHRRSAGTYEDPEGLAGFLGLLFPAVVGLTVSAWWSGPGRGRAIALGCCTLLLLAAIVGAGSWNMLFALVLAALFFCWLVPLSTRARAGLAAACIASAGFVLLSFHFREDLSNRLALWEAIWQLTERHPGLGVGAGNIGRNLGEFTAGLPFEVPYQEYPRNLVLELLASSGLAAVVAFLVAIGLAAWRIRRGWSQAKSADSRPFAGPDRVEGATGVQLLDPARAQRWEFVIGAMAGLVLAFLLRVPNLTADGILREGWQCGVRSIVWFGVFALCYTTGCTLRLLNLCCTGGALVLLLHLLTEASIGNPSLGQPFWVMVAMALNTVPFAQPMQSRRAPAVARFALPLAAGLCLVYFFLAFLPVVRSAFLVADARRHYDAWENLLKRARDDETAGSASSGLSRPEIDRAREYLAQHILAPIKAAGRINPDQAYISAELAYWLRVEWDLLMAGNHDADQVKIALNQALDATGSRFGSEAARDGAQQVDPRGKEGYLAEFRLHADAAVKLAVFASRAAARAEELSADAKKAAVPKERERIENQAAQSKQRAQDDERLANQEFDRAMEAIGGVLHYHPRDEIRMSALVENLRRAMTEARFSRQPR
jgi:O-antigen ligase